MASIGHIAVGLAAGRAYARARPGRAMVAFCLISIWPDADVLAFAFGIPYGDPFGHRGATHSLTAAVAVGLLAAALSPRLELPVLKTWLLTTAVAASHGLLDALTFGGGLGPELLWPFSTARFWSPVRLIPIAPIAGGMFSPWGLKVVLVELFFFSPFWLYGLWPRRRAAAIPSA
jgi:inner membrane protein